MNGKDGGRHNMEKPLKGAVLCCTSIPPEQRTHMAEAAIQMGAEHKLDLTSDVTHLIVGDSNTPKYKYVAREREDIKVLQLAWVEAVRQAWMQGDDFNLEALEEEYRLPTFAGLRICVTGFEDLTFRAQLQDFICANGGEYRGDLTKEVTHLIAYTPEGKKYQYAEQWDIKVVGLKWLKDSIDRCMILEEKLYHPTISNDKLGAGAWNRQPRAEAQLGKRSREEEEEAVPDVPRKLRRTASAKLGSQSENIWSEIVSGPSGENSANNDRLRTSRSLPVLKAVVMEPKSFATDSTGMEDDRKKLVTKDSTVIGQQRRGKGIFSGLGFLLHAFNSKQISILQEHILTNDGEILQSLTDSDLTATSNLSRLFLIIPHCHPFSDIPSIPHLNSSLEIVTDLWAERCLQSKRFFEPDEHVLSRPIRVFPIPGFEKLTINSTGVADIDLLHVSKAIKLLGAKYDQILKPGISVLLCDSSKAGEDKLRHATEWRIPTVSIDWLWACVRSEQMQPHNPFLVKQSQRSSATMSDKKTMVADKQPPPAPVGGRQQLASKGQHVELANPGGNAVHRDSFLDDAGSNRTSRVPRATVIPGEAFLQSPHLKKDRGEARRNKETVVVDPAAPAAARGQESQKQCDDDDEEPGIGLPLQEISTNSAPKVGIDGSFQKRPLFRHFDGQSSGPGRGQHEDTPSAPEATSTGKTTYIPPRADSINGAIKELLGKNRAKNMAPVNSTGESKKKRLLGRALSNMSNSSREGSNVRASRASSIDSVNTDGLGSVILDDMSQTKRPNSLGPGGRSSFTGRASAQERGAKQASFELGDTALYHNEYQEEEEPPQLTQLGYDNPDDAVALREMLAERRRNRTRKGQEDVQSVGPKEGKRIKDDVRVAATGWGSGRRTRQKAKSP